MAYLDTSTLTCPACGFKGDIGIVVGVGPNSEKGDVPYRNWRDAGPFKEGPSKSLVCPHDGTEVWLNKPAQKAAAK